MEEIWKDIEGFPGYKISNTGRVQSFMRKNPIEREIIWRISSYRKDGTPLRYAYVNLYQEKVAKNKELSVLLAKAFIYNNDPINKTEVDHIDRNSENNSLDNLRWVTKSQNKINRDIPIGESGHRHIRCFAHKPKAWGVNITRDRKTVYSKYFTTLEEAILHRDAYLASIQE